MREVSSLGILRFIAKRDEAHKNQISVEELAMAFPGIDSDVVLEKLFEAKNEGFIRRIGSWAYAPTQLGFDELAKI